MKNWKKKPEPKLFVLKHRTLKPPVWIGAAAGTFGLVVDTVEKAMKMPRDQWVAMLSKTALKTYKLVPFKAD